MQEIRAYLKEHGMEDRCKVICMSEIFDDLVTIGALEKRDNGKFSLTCVGQASFYYLILIKEFGPGTKVPKDVIYKRLVKKGLIAKTMENGYYVTDDGMKNIIYHLSRELKREEIIEYVKMCMGVLIEKNLV